MKRLLQLLLLVFLFTNCSDEFSLINDEVNLAEEWQELFVVYGNISPANEYHYIRVNRGYSAEDFNLGQETIDSIQYGPGELDVRLYVIDGEDTIKSYTCRDTIMEKDSGEFFNTGEIRLHYFRELDLLSANAENKMFGVEVSNGQMTATATTRAIGDFTFKYPPNAPNFETVEFEGSQYEVEVNQPVNSQALEVLGIGKYREIIEIGGDKDTIPHEFVFRVGKKVLADPLQSPDEQGFLGSCGGFYDAIEAHVLKYGDTVNAVRRRFDGVYFKAIAGNSDMAISTLATGSGSFNDYITAVGNVDNGLGLVSAYNIKTTKVYYISGESMNTIIDLYGTKYLFTR